VAIAVFTFLPVVIVRELIIAKTLEVLFVAIGQRFTTASFWAPENAIALGLYDCRLR